MLFTKPLGEGHRYGLEVFVGNEDWAATWRQREEKAKTRRVCSFNTLTAMLEKFVARYLGEESAITSRQCDTREVLIRDIVLVPW